MQKQTRAQLRHNDKLTARLCCTALHLIVFIYVVIIDTYNTAVTTVFLIKFAAGNLCDFCGKDKFMTYYIRQVVAFLYLVYFWRHKICLNHILT